MQQLLSDPGFGHFHLNHIISFLKQGYAPKFTIYK